MSYLDYSLGTMPTGWRKIFAVNWPLVFLLAAAACLGFLVLTSVGGGRMDIWAEPQMKRFAVGMVLMLAVGFVPIYVWRNVSIVAYLIAVLLLVAVDVVGKIGMGAQRWIEFGPIRLQPSELMKVAQVMMLAAYYDWLSPHRVSRPVWVLIPVLLILVPVGLVVKQPDLGTAIMLLLAGGALMLVAGVSLWYFGTVLALAVALVWGVLESRGTGWQILQDYQYRRIDVFLDPGADPLGAGYNIMQAQIALGSGGWQGKGYMQGTQARLNFLPEKQTDFIFTTLAEEFGFVGAGALLTLYALIVLFAFQSAMTNKDRYGALLTYGVGTTFFLFFAVNMGMVTGLMPVVGVPLPLVSYGGTAMMILLLAFGLVQSAHIHRPR